VRIVVEEIDGAFYSDIILSPAEVKRIKRNEMIEGQVIHRRRKCYVGVRLQGLWDINEDDPITSETEESD
jgi:hypothetical protein